MQYHDFTAGEGNVRIRRCDHGVLLRCEDNGVGAEVLLPFDAVSELSDRLDVWASATVVDDIPPGDLLVGDVIVDGHGDAAPATVENVRLLPSMRWLVELETSDRRMAYECPDFTRFTVRLPREAKG